MTTTLAGATTHYGQHNPDDCFACKMKTLQFNRPGFKTHQHKGDPWDGNPVKERMEEIRREGKKIAAIELTNPAMSGGPE